jgi:hypothetical protein
MGKSKFSKVLPAILVAALIGFTPAPAYASGWGAVVSAVWGAAQMLWSNIFGGLGKLANVVEGAAKMQIEAASENTKSINLNAIDIAKNLEIYRLGKEYQLPPDPCTTGEIAKYMDSVNRAYGGISSSFQPGGSRSRLETFRAADASVNAADDTPIEVRAAMVANAHAKYFCDVTEAQKYAGTKLCATKGELPGGDVKADSLFSGAKANANDPDSYTYTRKQVEAAQTYIANSTTPLAVRGLLKSEANTQQGVEYYAMALQARAKMSLANKGAYDALARRVPVPEAKAIVEAIKKGNPTAAAYYARLPHLKTEGISFLDLMDAEVGRRYRNPQWLADMSAASPQAVEREAVFMQSWQMDMQLKQYLLLERVEVLLGQLVASNVRQEMEPKLERKYTEVRGR